MVAAKSWLSELGILVGTGILRSEPSKTPLNLGILAFETAKTMSLLISLYKSLSDSEIRRLRLDVFRSEGIHYLNSTDEGFLINLACSERIEDLDRAALSVSRLGKKCRAVELQGFDRIYDGLKVGSVNMLRLGFLEKEIDKKIAKLEKSVSVTSDLYSSLEILNMMEVSERKLRNYSGPMPVQKSHSDLLQKKLTLQRKHVRRMREDSLWSQSFDKIVAVMARIVCNVFARICIVFGSYVSDLPQIISDGNVVFVSSPKLVFADHPQRSPPVYYTSGPLERTVAKDVIIRNSGPISQKPRSGINLFRNRKAKQEDFGFCLGFGSTDEKRRISRKRNPVAKEASRTSVGASGLAKRYANVIILAEKLVNCADLVDDNTREELYQMLPSTLRISVNAKLKNVMRCEGFGPCDELITDGWKEALVTMLRWLAPMAHNMMRWQTERNYENQRFDSKPTVLLLQTLYFSDREKTEAAIVELLVGLSCICRSKNRSSFFNED